MAEAARSSRRRSSSPSRSGSTLSAGWAIDYCFNARRARLARASRRHSASRLVRVWDMAVLLVTSGHEERPDRRSRQRSRRNTSCGPPTESRSGAVPQAIPSRRPPAATCSGPRRIEIPMIRADGWSAHGTKDAPRRSPERSPRCSPEPGPHAGRSPVRSPLHPQRRVDRRPLPLALTSSSSRPGRSPPPRRWPLTSSCPAQLTSTTTRTGERWEALVGQVVHGTARGVGHPRGAPPQPESAAGRLRSR
jgi:hypothetical protein